MSYHFGNPHLDTDWDIIKNDPAIADLLAGNPGTASALGDWYDARTTGSSATHDAVNAAGLPGGAADLLIHQALGSAGRWGNRAVDWLKGESASDRNKYDNIRDAQTDAFNSAYESKYGGRHSSSPFEAMFEDVVNNPGNWELRPDPTQDSAQEKGLKGRRLYPKPERNLGPRPSTRYTYGDGGKPTKKKSEWQKSQERRAAKRDEEEEERRMRAHQNQQRMNQSLQNYYSRVTKPNNIPPDVWEAYVPDEGMSNYSIFDASGGFKGLDVDGLMEAMGIPTGKKVDPSTGIEY
jgi:hypothetical protein